MLRHIYLFEIIISTGKLRLKDGESPYAGRLEVLVDDVWGSVCDDLVNDTVAEIFCDALGVPRDEG